MVEREYALQVENNEIDENTEVVKKIKIDHLAMIEVVLHSLKTESVIEVAKKMRVQVDGFRLEKAPKPTLHKLIARKTVGHRALGPRFILEAIKDEYPALFEELLSETNDFDIDHWVERCGEDILFFVLYVSDKEEHKSLLLELEERYLETFEEEQDNSNVIELNSRQANNQEIEPTEKSHELERLKIEIEKMKYVIAEKDRLLNQKEREIKKIEEQLQNERSNNGKRSAEIGKLRKENKELNKEVKKLKGKHSFFEKELPKLQGKNNELKEIVNNLNRLIAKNENIKDLYGKDLEKLLKEKRLFQVEALKWEARWRAGSFLWEKANESGELRLRKTIEVDPKELHQAYLDAVCKKETNLIQEFSSINETDKRKELLRKLDEILSFEETLSKFPLEEKLSLETEIEIDPIEVCSCINLDAVFSYEGPHGWARTKEGSFLISPRDVIRYSLVTGDRLNIFITRDFESVDDTCISFDVVQRVERLESICSLQKSTDGIYVLNPYSYDLQLSSSELEYININLDDPVSVIYPDLSQTQLKDKTIYARVVKSHDPTWEKTPSRERKRCEKRRVNEDTQNNEKLLEEPLLQGQTVLVVGGHSIKEQLRSVVESMSGNFIYQSGFEDHRTVEGNVKKASVVIIITREVSHSIQGLVVKAAQKYQVDCRYYNQRGAALFDELIKTIAS